MTAIEAKRLQLELSTTLFRIYLLEKYGTDNLVEALRSSDKGSGSE